MSLPQLLIWQALKYFVCEAGDQHPLRGVCIDAARAQVKKRIGIELADGCAVGGAHIVIVNFKLRLCVDHSLVGQQKVAIEL